ncbi:MAG: IS1096 element passenger TnpR family protein [Anaerolineae bacterium]
MASQSFTDRQGEYLALYYNYRAIHGRSPTYQVVADVLGVTPSAVIQMVQRLEELGLVEREPDGGVRVLVAPAELPVLRDTSQARPQKAKRRRQVSTVYKIKVALDDIRPPIWRRLLVPAGMALDDLHLVIQIAMGWQDYHLHQFIVDGTYFGVPHPDYSDFGMEMRDESRVRLDEIVSRAGARIKYEYDFGDGWLHTILVEEILPADPDQDYPVCIKGKRACPPEDVGGPWGYQHLLQALRDPSHPEHEDYTVWAGYNFDPEAFELDAVNAQLRDLQL